MTAIKQASEKEQHEQVREMIAQAHSKLEEQQQVEQGPTTIYYDEMETPVGTLTLCATDRGLCRIEFGVFHAKEALLQQWARTWIGEYVYVQQSEKLREAADQLREYFAGERREFSIAYDLRGIPFQEQVWHALQNIPYGQSVSYKDIAESIGRAKAVRAVGDAINKNPLPILIPCHRVSGANGSLVGYAGGLPVKTKLVDLEKE